MARTRPAADEFARGYRWIVHLPTGARWETCETSVRLRLTELGGLGSVMRDGRDYREYEVSEMAQALWRTPRKRIRLPEPRTAQYA